MVREVLENRYRAITGRSRRAGSNAEGLNLVTEADGDPVWLQCRPSGLVDLAVGRIS